MIPAHLIQKIRRMHLSTRHTVSGIMAGRYRSVFRGSGMEFEEVREYTPGDDVKRIDWRTTARMGHPYVKQYREERESTVILLLDVSASLGFGTFFGRKLEKSAEMAGVLAFNAICSNDKVGAILFTDQIEVCIPPRKGMSHVFRILQEVFTRKPSGRQTDIRIALDYVYRSIRKRAFVFVVSDFFSPDFAASLGIVSRRHEVIGIRITDPGNFQLPRTGMVVREDMETGECCLIDAHSPRVRRAFDREKLRNLSWIREVFKKSGCDLVEMQTDGSVADTLTRYFRLREKRHR